MEAAMNQVMEQAVLQAAQQLEDQVDQQIHTMENMSEDDVGKLRRERLAQLKKQQDKKEQWRRRGHGEYQFLANEKEFFACMKGEDKMVCHFFRSSLPCRIIDQHINKLCQQHLECKFAKIDAEQSPYLTDKLKIWMLPTLALIKNEKVVDYVVGLDDMGGREDFETEALARRLAAAGVLTLQESRGAAAAPQRSVRKAQRTVARDSDDEDSDFD